MNVLIKDIKIEALENGYSYLLTYKNGFSLKYVGFTINQAIKNFKEQVKKWIKNTEIKENCDYIELLAYDYIDNTQTTSKEIDEKKWEYRRTIELVQGIQYNNKADLKELFEDLF